ncbi:MAG: alpha/beta hydrolase [Flavobacteriales bacterium]|jgi:pimeloyl-ACP methyl ester carboxylesterase|nr:alpha/beta hydrolase [Flavobacteriales bacterium]
MTVYFLPGVGCDKRLFSRIKLPGHEMVMLEWPPFPKRCRLEELAAEMRSGVDGTKPHMLAGVSLGGMVAQELALLTKPEKVILISTWTGPHEWPRQVHVMKSLGGTCLIGRFTMWATWPFKRFLGLRDRISDQLLWDMAKKETAAKIRRGVEAVLRWKGTRWKGPVARIHGTNDQAIPMRFPVDHAVEGGGHVMVLTRAEEISRWMQEVINA